MRSACAICDRPVDLEAAPAELGEVICETCRKEVATAAGGATTKPAEESLPTQEAAPPIETAPASRRKAGRASFWLGDDEAAARDKGAAAPDKEPSAPVVVKPSVHNSSFEDLRLLAAPSEQRAPRHVDDLMNLRAEYFSNDGPSLEAPDLRRAASSTGGDARLAPTVDLLSALAAPPRGDGAATDRSTPEAARKRSMIGVGAGVVVGVLLTLGISQLLRSGDAPSPTPSASPIAAAAAKPSRTPEPAAVAEEPRVKALTPGAKAAADEPAPIASAREPAAEAKPAVKDAPGSTAGALAAASPGVREPSAGKEGTAAKEPKAAKEAPSAEPAAPAKPSEADTLLAAQNAALNAPKAASFSRSAAGAALTAAAGQAAGCKKEGDPAGIAKVSITFAPSGRVTNSQVVGGPYIGSAAGGCIARAFRGAQVPAFDGDPVTVQKAVDLR